MLAAESAALPLASMRNGPISQSAGIARTTKKTKIRAPKKSRKPKRRRRRRSRSSRKPGARPIGVATRTGSLSTRLVDIELTTGSARTRLFGVAAATGSGAGLVVAGVRRDSAGAAGGTDAAAACTVGALAWAAAAPPVSACSFALAGLSGADAARGCEDTAEVAGVASWTGGFVRLASRCCSCALSAA
ncbi:MAG: hypothetical protein QOH92_2616 [Chloroflexota bacterium]|jgi:hypothetical protein|nr:hypothetical protein [Chloroflexota bacterium]